MGKKHKLSNSRLEFTTGLSSSEVLDVAEFVADETRVTGWKYNKKVRVTLSERSEKGAEFVIGQRRPLIIFELNTDGRDGKTVGVTSIEASEVSQSKIAGFIPAGPKVMEGYPWYLQFMTNLEAGLKAKDPSTRCQLIERDVK